MKQPKRKNDLNNKKKRKTNKTPRKINHKIGTSKLEDDFASNFLDKLGIRYERQFEAKDIGRFYDFCAYTDMDSPILIEIDGSYFHSDPRLIKESEMNPMQKHNKMVDKIKDKWALMRGIPIYRIWEIDIRENPTGVLNELKNIFRKENKKSEIIENKSKRHNNVLK